jgi:WD40 repeat protein
MNERLRKSIVRILNAGGAVVGAGFLVSEKRLFTCAHIVADALDIPRNTQQAPASVIHLDFPLVAAGQALDAQVIYWLPIQAGTSTPLACEEDIAILELEGACPEAAQPFCLSPAEDVRKYTFRKDGWHNEHILDIINELLITQCPDTISPIELAFLRASQQQEGNWKTWYHKASRQQQIAIARQLAIQTELLKEQLNQLELSMSAVVEALRGLLPREAFQIARRAFDTPHHPIVCLRHKDYVNALAFSPAGNYLATASRDGTASIWEAATGCQVACLPHENIVWTVTFSPAGNYLATASGDNTARIWEVPSGRQVTCLRHEGTVWSALFSPAGNYLATASGDDTARIWEVPGDFQVSSLPHEGIVWTIAFSPDGQHLTTGSGDGNARVWEVTSGHQLACLNHGSTVYKAIFSAEGHYIGAASRDGSVRVWEMATSRQVAYLKHERIVYAVIFSPDSGYIAIASRDGTIRVWKLMDHSEHLRPMLSSDARAMAFNPDSTYLTTVDWDGTIVQWTMVDGHPCSRSSHKPTYLFHSAYLDGMAFSPDGNYMAMVDINGQVVVYELDCEHRPGVWRNV